VCSSVGASCRNQRIFCARKAVLLLLVWAAHKDQFAALSDRIMNLNVSCRKRFLLASERRIVGRVRADRINGFMFRAVLGIMPGWWVGGHGVDGVEQGRSMICGAFHLDIRMSVGGGETSRIGKFWTRKCAQKLSQSYCERRWASFWHTDLYRLSETARDLHILPTRFICCPRIEKNDLTGIHFPQVRNIRKNATQLLYALSQN